MYYISKFTPQSVNYHPDFSDSSWSFNTLSVGTDSIVSESSITINGLNVVAASSSLSILNQTVIYNWTINLLQYLFIILEFHC